MEHGRELVTFAKSVLSPDLDQLAAARRQLLDCMGPAAVVSASIIAAGFSMVDRAANAIGISVDAMVMTPSEEFRERLGINRFPSAANTLGGA